MRRFGAMAGAAALCAALAVSGPAAARGGFGGGGFHGGGFHGGGFGGGGFHGGGFHGGGWHGGGWGGGGWGGGCWGCYAGVGLLGLGLGYGLASGWDYGYPYDYAYGYGYPYGNAYGYGYPSYGYSGYEDPPGYSYAAPAYAPRVATTAPLQTGRSVATGSLGDYCTTPVKRCQLYHASYLGVGCSCRVSGGHARGTVSP